MGQVASGEGMDGLMDGFKTGLFLSLFQFVTLIYVCTTQIHIYIYRHHR